MLKRNELPSGRFVLRFSVDAELLGGGWRRGLGGWLGGVFPDDVAGAGVVEVVAGGLLDGVGVGGFELLDVVTEAGVLLLEVADVLLELAVLGALLMPDGEAVAAVDDVPGEQECEADGDCGSGGTPETVGAVESAPGHRLAARWVFLDRDSLKLHATSIFG
jgi:hypothetical protein